MIRGSGIEGNRICGLVETLSNDKGINLAKMANIDEIPVGFSCRAIGQVKPKKINGESIMEVTQPSIFVTYDSVVDPSHKTAQLQDITSVITSDGELEKFRGMTESDQGMAAINECETLIGLREFFRSAINTTQPMKLLLENFMNDRIDNTMSPLQESEYVHRGMNQLLSDYLSSSDYHTGISEYDDLNESNVRAMMDDYANDYRSAKYQTLRGMRGVLNAYLS